MTVLHLHRVTALPRVSISAANILCSRHPHDEDAHEKIWSIIASQPTKPINLATLEMAYELLS